MVYKIVLFLLLFQNAFSQHGQSWHNSIRPFSKLPYHKHYFINSYADTIKAVVQISKDSVEVINYLKAANGNWAAYFSNGAVREIGLFKVYRVGKPTVFKVKEWQHFSLSGELLYIIHYSKNAFVECGLPNKFQIFTIVKRPPNDNE